MSQNTLFYSTNQKPYRKTAFLFTELSWIFCGRRSLYILHSNLKTYNFSLFLLLFVLIWCRSGEIVVGQVDFSSPPDRLSCKDWETFANCEIQRLYC